MVNVTIKSSGDSKVQLDVELTQTVLELKQKVADSLEDTPVSAQRLIYAGRILKDEDKLSVYKIADGNTIHMVKSGPKKKNTQPTTGGAISDAPAAAAEPNAQSQPQQQQQQQPAAAGGMPNMADMASMFGGMGGMGGMGNMGNMGGMPQMSPEMLEQMYSNPMVQQMMEQMFSNPELMRSMIDSNPMLQQQMTPQMRQMLDNPEMLRMATNPDVMRAAANLQASMQRMQPQNNTQGSNPGIYNPWASSNNPLSAPAPAPPQPYQPHSPPQQPEQQQSQEPPEQRYATQLQQLNDMGFWDRNQNINALNRAQGDVNRAIEVLLTFGNNF